MRELGIAVAVVLVLLVARQARGATRMYLHDSASSFTGYKVTDTGLGSGVTTAVTNTTAGPQTGITQTKTAGSATLMRWVSCPLEATTISGSVSFKVWGQESHVAANSGPQVRVNKFTGLEGAVIINSQAPGSACQASGTGCTEFSTSNSAITWSATPTSTAIAAGDRISVTWLINDASASMNSGRTVTTRYDGATAGASGDSYVEFVETLTCAPPIEPEFMHGFDAGKIPIEWISTGSTGTPTLTFEDSSWWLDFTPTSGATEFTAIAIAGGGQTHTLHFAIRVKAFPAGTCVGGPLDGQDCDPEDNNFPCGFGGGGSCSQLNEQHVASIRATTNRQALVTIGSDRRLRVYFRDTNDECTINSLYAFTECVAESDCPSDIGGNPGEAGCGQAVFAQSTTFEVDTTQRVAIMSTSGTVPSRPHDMTMDVYVNGRSIGRKTRHTGTCSGGSGTLTSAGKACGATADCLEICDGINELGLGTCSGGVCITPVVLNATEVRLGTDETGLEDARYLLDDVTFTSSDVDPNARFVKVASLWPNADSAVTWTDINAQCAATKALCVDDTKSGGALDDDAGVPGAPSSTLQTNTLNAADIFDVDNYTIGTGETVIAAMARAAMREDTNNSDISKNVVIGLRRASPATDELLGVTIDMANPQALYHPGEPAGGFHVLPGAISMTIPGGSSFTQTEVNGLRLVVRYTGTTATTKRVRNTNSLVELLVSLPQPAVTNLFPDVNQDGRKRACVVGDSIMNDPALYEALNGMLYEPTDLLDCGIGGRRIGDIEAAFGDILECSTTGSHPCVVERGEAGACDVVFLHIGANNFSRHYDQMQDPGTCQQRGCVGGTGDGQVCVTSATCGGGTCTDFAGPQHGDACDIATGVKSAPAGETFISNAYCTGGDNVTGCCAGIGCSTICGGHGMCASGANINNPCTVATATADCGSGITCTPWDYAAVDLDDADQAYTHSLCRIGAINRPSCPSGVCLHQTTTAYMAATWNALLDEAEARTGLEAVKVVLLGNTDPYVGTPMHCVGGADHLDECDEDADCASPGLCKLGYQAHWEGGIEMERWSAAWLEATARARNLPYINLGAYMRRVSDDDNENLRDFIHCSDLGQTRMAEAITACATRDTSIIENKCGDLTVDLTCPTAAEGLVPISSSFASNRNDKVGGSPWCVATGAVTVDAIVAHIGSAPSPNANLQCSVYTLSASTMTKVNAGCDTASTQVTDEGWLAMPTTTPASCVLSAGTYWTLCNTDNAALGLTVTTSGGPGFRTSTSAHTYASGMPSSTTIGFLGATSFSQYLQVTAQ